MQFWQKFCKNDIITEQAMMTSGTTNIVGCSNNRQVEVDKSEGKGRSVTPILS